eukprot:1159088-Pelagomonas_calceolata.AAC.12
MRAEQDRLQIQVHLLLHELIQPQHCKLFPNWIVRTEGSRQKHACALKHAHTFGYSSVLTHPHPYPHMPTQGRAHAVGFGGGHLSRGGCEGV